MRLQVFLSRSGVCSRRQAMIFVQSGCVEVNGRVCCEPSTEVVSGCDKVVFRGRPIVLKEKTVILLHKPCGVTSTTKDRFAEKTVLDLLPKEFGHLYCVGRLDKESTGLLLLTNDGDLALRLTHPSFETQKTYRVELNKALALEDARQFERGLILEGKKTALAKIIFKTGRLIDVVLREGRKRQIRKMFALLHYHVVTLSRIQEGPLTLGALKEGQWRFLTKEETEELYQATGLMGHKLKFKTLNSKF
jgi:23S rRNA pseudouridine2605 synthase